MTNSPPAKKSLGQHWLVNSGVLDRIVQAANIRADDTVLEIGPGTGALTERLAHVGSCGGCPSTHVEGHPPHVIAIEKDRRLIAPLREKFATHSNVDIVEADILELEPSAYRLTAGSYKIVANIPYYLSSRLIRLMLERWPRPSLAVLMVQLEVAQRMMAASPDMNLLALSVQLHTTPSLVMRVSRGSFRPMPDVDSAVIKLVLKDFAPGQMEEAQKIMAIARKAFGQKRKQITATVPKSALECANILPSSRPQELSVDDWRRIARAP